MNRPNYVIIPMLGNWDETEEAIRSLLEQNVRDLHILAIDQGRHCMGPLTKLAMEARDRIETWHPDPPMPSLAATWNVALKYVWARGGMHALVVNNDAVFRETTYEDLLRALQLDPKALFVTGYGSHDEAALLAASNIGSRGGPDFSCFLIKKECHVKYQFDENFVPAYCEDLDYHRQMLLAGDGPRIYSVGVVYWHREGGSGTLRKLDAANRAQLQASIQAGSRRYYVKKWGGAVNDEQFTEPFGQPYPFRDEDGINPISTAQLFEEVRQSWTTPPSSPSASESTETPPSKTSPKTTSSGSSEKSTGSASEQTSEGSTSKSSSDSSDSSEEKEPQ